VLIRGELEARGIDADEVFRAAGIQPGDYDNTDKRVPFEAMDHLFRLTVERTGDPSIGVDIVNNMNPLVYEALGIALFCSSTLRNFFRRFERFFDIVSTLEHGVFCETDYGGYFAEKPFVEYSDVTLGVHADAFVGTVIKFMRLVYQPDYKPRRVDLSWTPPAKYHDKYRQHFGPNVEFSAPITAIHVDRKDLDAPLAGSSATLAFHNDQLATATLVELKKEDLRTKVYARLIEYLPAGDCSREKVAYSLNMSKSAFQKRLKAEGTTYQDVLDNTRSELARHYIGTSGMSLSEVTFLLGFTDISNFSRAFTQWVGVSPSKFREQKLQE